LSLKGSSTVAGGAAQPRMGRSDTPGNRGVILLDPEGVAEPFATLQGSNRLLHHRGHSQNNPCLSLLSLFLCGDTKVHDCRSSLRNSVSAPAPSSTGASSTPPRSAPCCARSNPATPRSTSAL